MDKYHVLKTPLITEKATFVKYVGRVLAFKVDPHATKKQIKDAVEKIFKVKVEGVRVANVHGKVRRLGKSRGKRPDWKKAYVKLREGEKMIDFLGGV